MQYQHTCVDAFSDNRFILSIAGTNSNAFTLIVAVNMIQQRTRYSGSCQRNTGKVRISDIHTAQHVRKKILQ